MSRFIEVFHKMTRKRAVPRIMFNSKDSSYILVGGASESKLQNQCIQPQVGMYSVLSMDDHVDLVVRYEKTLPYTLLPASSDEECPQVTYVMPKHDMKIGDFFTLFVGREHFIVQVVQILSKSSSGHGSEKNSDSSSLADTPRTQPVQSSVNRHSRSGSHSSITGDHRQDGNALNPLTQQPIKERVKKPLPPRPDLRDNVQVFCTRTPVDVGKTQKLDINTRVNVPTTHPNRIRPPLADFDTTSHEPHIRPSDKVHQTINNGNLDLGINVTFTPPSPLTNIQPSRRPEGLKPQMDDKISDTSKTTRDKEKVLKKSTAEHNNNMLPSGTAALKSSHEPQTIPIAPIRQEEDIPSKSKKIPETNREPPRSNLLPREPHNIGSRGYEIGTLEDSSNSTTTSSVDSYLSYFRKPRPSGSLERSRRKNLLALVDPDIQGLDGDYVIGVAPKHVWISLHDFERLRLRKGGLHA